MRPIHAGQTAGDRRKTADQEPWFGIEQEYTFFDGARPLGWPKNGFPAPQGGYYCGVGADEVFGRDIVEDHLDACIAAGLQISGINAEVMPCPMGSSKSVPLVRLKSQTSCGSLAGCSTASRKTTAFLQLHPKPVLGDWNGAGTHTTSRPSRCVRDGIPSSPLVKHSAHVPADHIANYGDNIELRLTGDHETCSYKEFKYGVSDRGASIRIPWMVDQDKKGYIEDRRPNANCDPYLVTRLILETVCGVS